MELLRSTNISLRVSYILLAASDVEVYNVLLTSHFDYKNEMSNEAR